MGSKYAEPWLTERLTTAQRQRARTVACVAEITVGANPAMTAEIIAVLSAALLAQVHDHVEAEAVACRIIDHILRRVREISRQNDRLAHAALGREHTNQDE